MTAKPRNVPEEGGREGGVRFLWIIRSIGGDREGDREIEIKGNSTVE